MSWICAGPSGLRRRGELCTCIRPDVLHGRLDERAGVLAHELVQGAFDEAFCFLSRVLAGADDGPDRLLARRVLGLVEVALPNSREKLI